MRFRIKFKYKDKYSHNQWSSQSCSLIANSPEEAKRKCIEIYGLEVDDCEYEITKVEEE